MPQNFAPPLPKALPDLDGIVRAVAAMHGSNRTKVARIIGITQPGMVRMLKGRNPRVAQLMALCNALQYNLFDVYVRQLPEHLRTTTETRQLQAQLEQVQQERDAMQQELEAVKRERDLLLSIMKAST